MAPGDSQTDTINRTTAITFASSSHLQLQGILLSCHDFQSRSRELAVVVLSVLVLGFPHGNRK